MDPRPSDIWIVDLVRESADRFTTDGHNIDGSWSPDGRHLLFYKDGAQHLIRWPEGTGLRPLSDEPAPLGRFSPSWTLDGRVLLFENRRGTGRDLVAIRATDGRIDDFLATAADEWAPRVSPDGRLVAFTSNVSGDDEVYVMPLDQSASPRVVSFGGGIDPSWSADNSELFYRSGNAIMSVRVGAGHLALGRPTELFSGSYDFTQEHNWGVLPDGRFVMVKADPASMRQFQVVLNWFEELTTPSR